MDSKGIEIGSSNTNKTGRSKITTENSINKLLETTERLIKNQM